MPAVRAREVAAATGLAALVALSIGAAMLAPPSDENLPPGSSFSHAPAGAAAAYQTLERLAYPIRRTFDPLAALAVDPASTVLIVAEPDEDPTNSDRRAVQDLAAAGATVLLTGCGGVRFLADTDVPTVDAAAPAQTFMPRMTSPLTEGVARLSMRADCGWWNADSRYAVVYGDGRRAAVRVMRAGRGAIVWWAGSSPLTNAAISDSGGLELLLNIVGSGRPTILWDEFYHGQRRSLYSYAKRTPLPWAVAQLVLVLAVAGAMYARRRAPVLLRPAEPRTSTLEFIDTMAGLYARAGTASDAVVTARLRLRRLLAEATGVAVSAGDDRLARAAASRLRLDARELSEALVAAAGPLDEQMSADAALPLVRRLQTCAAAIERNT